MEHTGKPDARGKHPNSRANLAKGPKTSGRKPKSASPTHWLKEFGAMTGEEAAAKCRLFAKQFKQAGNELPLAAVAAAAVWLNVISDPSAGMFSEIAKRIDGAADAEPPKGNTFNTIVMGTKPDDGTIGTIFGILAGAGALEAGLSLAAPDEVYPAQADAETSGIPFIAAP